MINDQRQRGAVLKLSLYFVFSFFMLLWSGVYFPKNQKPQKIFQYNRRVKTIPERTVVIPLKMLKKSKSNRKKETKFIAEQENRYSGKTANKTVSWRNVQAPSKGTDRQNQEKNIIKKNNIRQDKIVELSGEKLKQSMEVLQQLPHKAIESSDMLVNFTSDGHIMLATKAYKYANYFHKMVKKIAEQWYLYFPKIQHYHGLLKSGQIVVLFELDRDGVVVFSKIIKSYGQESLDRACLTAVRQAREFGPLPKGLRKKSRIRIPFVFVYKKPERKIPMF